MKEKWIKIEGGEKYVKVEDEYTHIEIDRLSHGSNFYTFNVSIWNRDFRSRITITRERESKEEAQKILDKFMNFFVDDDFDIVDMDVIVALALDKTEK